MTATKPPPAQDPADPRRDAGTLKQGIAADAALPSPRDVEDRIRFAKDSLPGQRDALRSGTLRNLHSSEIRIDVPDISATLDALRKLRPAREPGAR